MRPPPGPVPEHGQALRPRRAARAAAARPSVPGPRSSTPTATTCASAAPRTPRCRSSGCCGRSGSSATRQLEPARPVHHPGPRRGRPAAPVTPPLGLSRRAVPRRATPARTPAGLAWAMTAPGSCPRSTPAPPAVGGWTCTSSGTPQPPISATRSPPPADHGQDPAQVPAHRHARRRSRGRGHQPARPAKADSLTTGQLCGSPGRPRSSAGLPWLFPMCTEAARLPWRVDASLLGEGHPRKRLFALPGRSLRACPAPPGSGDVCPFCTRDGD